MKQSRLQTILEPLTEEERLLLASDAQALLGNKLFEHLFLKIENRLVNLMSTEDFGNVEAHHQYCLHFKVLRDIKIYIENMAKEAYKIHIDKQPR